MGQPDRTTKPRTRVTLKDIARLAEVSVPTVSRVLKGEGRVAPATRERILNTAERLSFQPNALAQQLVTGRSNTVGILTVDAPALFHMAVATGALTELGRADVAAQLYDTRRTDRGLVQCLRTIDARRMDGVLMIGDGTARPIPSISNELDVPVVYVFGVSTDATDVSLIPDSHTAGRMAADYLMSLGRTKIAHITADADQAADARAAGLLEALRESGFALAGGRPVHGDWYPHTGAAGVRQLLDRGVDFDAIFCGNDSIAVGAHRALTAAGRTVSHDVSLIGFDNSRGFYGPAGSTIATIDPCLGAMGATAAELLLKLICGETVAQGIHPTPCRLVPPVAGDEQLTLPTFE